MKDLLALHSGTLEEVLHFVGAKHEVKEVLFGIELVFQGVGVCKSLPNCIHRLHFIAAVDALNEDWRVAISETQALTGQLCLDLLHAVDHFLEIFEFLVFKVVLNLRNGLLLARVEFDEGLHDLNQDCLIYCL